MKNQTFKPDYTVRVFTCKDVMGILKSNNIKNEVYLCYSLPYSLRNDNIDEDNKNDIIEQAKKYCTKHNLKLISY